MFSSEHIEDGHIKRLTVTRGESGWDVREEYDSRLVRVAHYVDWHRVERARQMFELRHDGPLPAGGR